MPALNETRSARFVDRLTRRAALLGGAATLAALATRPATAQDAAPDTGSELAYLFVQSAGPTTLVPGEGDVHTLTLTEVTAQTLYFSDRPNRVAGTTPTQDIAAGWGQVFASSAPNGVLVGHLAEGEEAVVVELREPVYDGEAGTLTYQVRILEAEEIGDRAFAQEPLTVLDAPRDYTEAHLFIDDAGDCAACIFGWLIVGDTDPCRNC